MDRRHKRHTARSVVLALLLAVLCVGAAELFVCRYEDPQTFARVTAPAVSAAERALGFLRAQASALAGEASALRARAGETIDALLHPAPEFQALQAILAAGEAVGEAAEEAVKTAADPAVTELTELDGREVLTGGVPIVYYNQADGAWAGQLYGRDPMETFGCGPTAMAMLVSSLTDEDVDPLEMAELCVQAGYWAPGSGSYLSIVEGVANHYNLNCAPLSTADAPAVELELAAGGVVVALMGPGHFTQNGHFILLHGATLDGKILVADPNSRENSLTAWDLQLILDELSGNRGNGAPLWLVTLAGGG